MFEKGSVDRLLEVMEKDIFRLELLIESSSRAAPIRQEARKKLTRRPWQSIQTAAHSLFTAISLDWRRKCTDCHSSFLKLNTVSPSLLDKTCLIPQQADSMSGSHPLGILPPMRDLYIQGQSPASPLATQKRFWIQNETLFTFSILLLELSYLKPLSSFKISDDVDTAGNDTSLTEHSIAARLAGVIRLKEPSQYSDAVQRCLYCLFDTSSRDLADSSLQEEFWRAVVEPLRELDAILA